MSLRQVSITSYVYSKRERRDYFNPSILKSTWFQNSRNLTVILQSHKIILDALSFNMASALLLMQFSAWTRIGKKTDTPLIQWSFYLRNASFLHNWKQCIESFSLWLQRYVRKGVRCNQKNPDKCSANVRNSFLRNTSISWEPFVTISWNLAQK